MTRALVARKRKIFALFFALAASVGLSWATVITWDQSKVSTMAMNVSSGSDSKTSDGITVTAVSTGEVVLFGDGCAIEIGNGEGSGGGYLTFTSSVGNIAQIDINHSGAGEWRNANGDWISPYYENFEGGTFTWSGTPAASITLTGDAPRHIENITSIEFTIEDGGGSTPANACGDGLIWELKNGELTISYTGTGIGVMDNYASASDAPWYSYKDDITSVTITDGVKSVGSYSFGYYGNLVTVTIGNDVETIGEYAFGDCYKFTTLNLGNSVKHIGNRAFMWAKVLTGFTLPSTLETIGDRAFLQNKLITSLTIPSSVTSIGQSAFMYCAALTSITVEATTPPTLKETVFDGVPTSIPLNVPNGSVAVYTAADQWNAFDIQGYDPAPGGGSTPANVCGDGLTWELNGGVLTISYDGEGTGEMTDFGYENDQNPVNVAPWKENKSEITTVIVGDGVKSIGNYAFNDLSENFKAVTIANSVERIGVFAFTNSEEITEITLPSSLKTIDERGFANCGFTSITIPSGVTSIGYQAFSYCTGLTSLTCEATTPPTLGSGVFYKITRKTSDMSSIPLYVPSGSVAAYEAAAQWNAFDIQGYDPAPGGGSTPTVWTSLSVGDVIKVGDQLSPSVEWGSANDYGVIKPDWAPYTLLRANIAQDEYDELVVTEAEDGAYYVLKFTHPSAGTYYLLSNSAKGTLLAATATSDGLEVTNVGDYYGTPQFTFAVHDGGGSTPTPSGNGDKLAGKFSVSASQVVYFSRGNLQYQASTNTWRFAENQYDAVGGSNGSNNAAPYNTSSANDSPSDSQTGWIDLFGWAASGITRTGVTAYQPYSTSTNNADYGTTTTKSADETLGDYDWGKNMGDGWRTLTAEEWGYLIGPGIGGTTPSDKRANYQSLRGLCKITVSGTDYPGLMILPDDLYNNLPSEGSIASKWSACAVAAASLNYTLATFTEAEWTALQAAGAVFLPAAGYRYTTVNYAGAYGDYWSSSASSDKLAFFLRFYAGYLNPENSGNRYNGRSVRLVSDIAPDPAPAGPIPCTAADLGKVLCTDGSIYATVSEAAAASKTAAAVIAYVDTQNGKALALALADDGGEMDWATAKTTAPAHTPAVSGGTWTLASQDDWNNMITAAGGYTALRDGFSAVGGTNMQQNAYWSSTSFMYYAWCYKFNNGEWFDDYQDGDNYVRACLAFDIPAAPAYETVMNLINAIGEVAYTAECKAKIDEARAAYNALSDGDKAQITNIATLTGAETAYKNLVLDAAQPAIAAIKAIPSPITSNLKLSAYEKVTAAREAYDALTDEEKAAIPEYLAILEEAEAAFAAIPSVGSETVITWDKNTGIEEISGTTTSPAYEGITISIKGGGFGPKDEMLRFSIGGLGLSFEFANTLEGNFQKIVISSTNAMPSTPLAGMGEGWAGSNENKTATWTGDAATVKIWDGLTATSFWDVNTIQFTLGATVSATEAAQAAKDLIDAIGEVSYPDSKEAIKAAREAVDALGANASLLDDADLNKLTQAETAYAQLLAQAVAAVKDQIDALPDTPLTDATKKLSEYNKVTDAREAYDALSDEEKAAVTNYGKLEAAEAAFAAIGGGTGLNVSTEDIGKVLCADGSLYATKDEATAASKTPVAMIAYVEDSKGLAIALEDESNTMIWSTAITTAAAHTPAVTGGTWKLPSLLEWQQMFVGCGADLTPSETSGAVTDYIGLRDKLLAAGGKGFVEWSYWTTTEWANNPAEAWDPYFSFSPELVKWYTNKKDRDDFYIRAILAFNVVASKALADAQAAKDLIDAIPSPVVLSDECNAAIKAARDAVTALGENASLLDDADIDKLAKAEADFALLIKDATTVAGMIDAIGEVTFSADSKGKIEDAREAYEALSDELKPYVSNIDKLTAAEAAYEAARPFAPVTTVPAAVEALQYTGATQALITAGAAEHGTVLYSLDGENYSTELPTALLAGAYTIYYKVQATDDYKDVAPVTVIATIAYNYPATYGLFGIPEGWSVKVNDEEVAVVNGAVKNIAANDRFDIMPVKPEDVKRVEIVPYLLDLATVTDSVIYILDGDSITGTANGHITVVIVPDAKVYFKDVNLTNTGSHPAVLCGGNAEIVVVGENTITCTKEDEYGIRASA